MNFLFPAFLVASAALALPVLFHFLRKSPPRVMEFSSLMFVPRTAPAVSRRRTLEHFWLLCLRLLVLAGVVLAFARPYVRDESPTPPPKPQTPHLLILLDTSASMRRAGVWDEARKRVQQAVDRSAKDSQVELWTFDHVPRPQLSWEDERSSGAVARAARVAQVLQAITPSWMETRLGTALTAAATRCASLTSDTNATVEILLVSDLQRGAHVAELASFVWPPGVRVRLERVMSPARANAIIHWLPASASAAPDRDRLRFRVLNERGSVKESFVVGWTAEDGSDYLGATAQVQVGPGTSQTLTTPPRPADARPLRLALKGDDDAFGNVLYHVAQAKPKVRVSYLGADDPSDTAGALFYLRLAVGAFADLDASLERGRPAAGAAASVPELPVIAGTVDPPTVAALKNHLETGGRAVLFVRDLAQAELMRDLTGQRGLELAESDVSRYALLGETDRRHPLFAGFEDARYGDFSKIHFWHHRVLRGSTNEGCRVLARFDNGEPAIAEFGVGKGTLCAFLFGWQPAESQWPLSSKFAPIVRNLLDQVLNTPAGRVDSFVGQPLPQPAGAQQTAVRKPDGTQVTVAWAEGRWMFDQPGVYRLHAVDGEKAIAVNLAPEELRTEPMAIDELERMGIPLASSALSAPSATVPVGAKATPTLKARDRELWPWFLGLALLAAFADTWVAARIDRRAALVGVETNATP